MRKIITLALAAFLIAPAVMADGARRDVALCVRPQLRHIMQCNAFRSQCITNIAIAYIDSNSFDKRKTRGEGGCTSVSCGSEASGDAPPLQR